jgi:glycosyltransferase involved in cell wall biosynthesis
VRDTRILYVVNHAAFFVSHRLPLAISARDRGYDVGLITGQAGSTVMDDLAVRVLEEKRVPHDQVAFRSDGLNPFVEAVGLLQLIRLMKRRRPDLVHCASPKGCLYGGLAARICGVPALVIAVSGVGFALTKDARVSMRRRLSAAVQSLMSRFVFGHPNLRVIVQNRDDLALMSGHQSLSRPRITLIRGSGVALEKFAGSRGNKEQVVLLPARMLRDKGVEEFVAAAKLAARQVPGWRFLLAGAGDYRNPSAISRDQLNQWNMEGVVEWLGHVDDMLPLYRMAAIVCLPSYREGLPKSLLEAAAAGCAVVTTDVPGCREAVVDGQTGDIVPPRDIEALAGALVRLMQDGGMRQRYAVQGEEYAARSFGIDAVVNSTMEIYRDLLRLRTSEE